MNQQIKLSDEKFQEIFTDDEFLHDCSHPIGCCNVRGFLEYFRTCTYPIEYIITEEQISIAKDEFSRRKRAFLEGYKKGTLVLVCMGMDYESKYSDGIGNHRVRGDFMNSKGHRYFVEFGRSAAYLKDESSEKMRCDHSVDREIDDDGLHNNNAFGLERRDFCDIPYTKSSLLEIVNSTFGCNFSEIILDRWLIRSDDIISFC